MDESFKSSPKTYSSVFTDEISFLHARFFVVFPLERILWFIIDEVIVVYDSTRPHNQQGNQRFGKFFIKCSNGFINFVTWTWLGCLLLSRKLSAWIKLCWKSFTFDKTAFPDNRRLQQIADVKARSRVGVSGCKAAIPFTQSNQNLGFAASTL